MIALRWLLLLAGCAPEPSDRERYLALLSDVELDPAEGLTRCEALLDPDLRGDCSLHMADRALRRNQPPEELCQHLPTGPWRDECWFVAAEVALAADRDARAAALCRQSGAFSEDCAQHLWQGRLHALIHGRGSQAFVEILPRARQLHDRWAPLIGGGDAFSRRFWIRYYQNGFEGDGNRADLSRCAPLPDADRALCEVAAIELYARELDPALERHAIDLCSLEAPSSQSLAPYLPAAPDPRLDAIIAERRQRCEK